MSLEQDMIFGRNIDSILGRYVDSEGAVDYLTLSMEEHIIKYVESLGNFDLAELKSKNEKLAFWINTYNMITVYAVIKAIEKDPQFVKQGNNSLFSKFRFFYLNKYVISGKKYNLLDIENKILRKKCKEPRIHFALVCGAGSCPVLKNGLYSSGDIDKELDIAAQIFINSPKGIKLDKDNNTIQISRIFKWYKKDFGKEKNSVLRFISRYHPEKEYIETNIDILKIRYLDYNWGLNIKD